MKRLFWTAIGLIVERFITHPISGGALYSFCWDDYSHVPVDGEWHKVVTRHGWVTTSALVRKNSPNEITLAEFTKTVPWRLR